MHGDAPPDGPPGIDAPGGGTGSDQPTLELLAGNIGGPGSVDDTGTAARFSLPRGVALDGAGNVYIADTQNGTIRKASPAGVVTTLAGTPGTTGYLNGTGAAAQFSSPQGLVVDRNGNLFVADSGNHTIRQITPAGVVTTFAGDPVTRGGGDGVGAAASFAAPASLAIDSAGNFYVADPGNHTIRKITPAAIVTTLAGTADQSASIDANGTNARFNGPSGVTVDSVGNVYVADSGNHTIRKITPDGEVTTFAGTAGMTGSTNGHGAAARFNSPDCVATDNAGNVYVSDRSNHTIRKVTPDGTVSTIAGTALKEGSDDGGTTAKLAFPAGIAFDSAANLYIADSNNNAIRKLSPSGIMATFVGTVGVSGFSDGTGTAAHFRRPSGVAVDRAGNLFVADEYTNSIREVTPSGVVTTFAGTSMTIGDADGTGPAARFNAPQGVAIDSNDNVYVADSQNDTIRRITPAGVVTTFAGLADMSGSDNGTGSAARFFLPSGVAADSANNIYIADRGNNTIRKSTTAGAVTTFAGSSHSAGSDDGGTAARFSRPDGTAVDNDGTVYVSDSTNNTIRKISRDGIVSTLAGTAEVKGSADGTGPAASFNLPLGIAVDNHGNVYVADYLSC